jgi:hypothetical protein
VRVEIVSNRSGRAGIVATFAFAVIGTALGATIAYLSGRGDFAAAYAPESAASEVLSIPMESALAERARIVDLILSGGAPERLAAPAAISGRPRIIIIFDDMGLDRGAFEEVMRLPGPLTLSFLP